MNLKQIFGTDIQNASVKQSINQAILDKILERTARSTSVDGKKFKRYSKSYINSDDFQAFGKSPGQVNLRLTGDMLELMDVLEETKNTTTIGWDDADEGSKAHGHITGSGNLPKRDFFGLTKRDIDEIREQFSADLERDSDLGTAESSLLDAIRLFQLARGGGGQG